MPTERPVPREFIRAHTRPRRPSLVPEVVLHVAGDVVALWEAMEAEHGSAPLAPPFWSAAWPGGQVLARYVLDTPGLVAGRPVLDVGSGSGLVAIAAALADGAPVVASEIDAFATTAVALNAGLNGVTGIRVTGDVLGGPPPDEGVVLAGDVCYDREMSARVLPYLRAARHRGCDVLIGDPGRVYLPSDRLTPVAGYDVPETEGPGLRRATVWRLS